MELEELQDTNQTLVEKLKDLHRAHQKEVSKQEAQPRFTSLLTALPVTAHVALKRSSNNQKVISRVPVEVMTEPT